MSKRSFKCTVILKNSNDLHHVIHSLLACVLEPERGHSEDPRVVLLALFQTLDIVLHCFQQEAPSVRLQIRQGFLIQLHLSLDLYGVPLSTEKQHKNEYEVTFRKKTLQPFKPCLLRLCQLRWRLPWRKLTKIFQHI